jgi:sortase A
MRRFVEIFVLAAGLAGVGTWVWSEVRLYNSQKAASRTLEHKLAPPHVLESGELLGRLTILRLKLESVVREGAGEKTLDVALGHIPGTVLPGGAGNVGITGHRDTLFRGLRHIARNDVIQLQTTTGAYSYQVEDTSIVKPDDVGVLNAGAHPELTLVTCYPFYYVGPAPDRFIVNALGVAGFGSCETGSSNATGRHCETARPKACAQNAASRRYPEGKV